MSKIVVKRKAEIYKELLLRQSQSRISVGSDGDNDLIISDKKVSGHHLVIEREGRRYFVTDLNSAFGTRVNGKPIEQKMRISSGDEILLGDHRLIFENILYENSGQVDEKPTTDLNEISDDLVELEIGVKANNKAEPKSRASDSSSPTTNLPQPSVEDAGKQPVVHYLIAIYGPLMGKKYRLNFGVTRIGRDKELNDIVINQNSVGEADTSISRRHATIIFEHDNFFILDKRSKTRTRLNRYQLKEDELRQLSPGDEIEIVSDKESTIFRFVAEGQENNNRPQKSGYWWIRNRRRLGSFVSFLLGAAAVLAAVYMFGKLMILIQKPVNNDFAESIFYAETNVDEIFLTPDEAAQNMTGLTPGIADLNGDSFPDLIYLDKIGYLRVINGKTRIRLWESITQYRAQPGTCPVLADVNANGLPDVIIATNQSVIYALEGATGNEIWASPILGGEFTGNPIVADLNGDGLPDIVACSRDGQVHIGYGRLTEPQWKTIGVDTEISNPASAGDVDGDGLPEIVFADKNGQIFIYDINKKAFTHNIDVNEQLQKAKGSLFERHEILRRIAVGPLNNDQFMDLLILTESNHLLALDVQANERIWYDRLKTEPDSGSLAPPNLADLNGDEIVDVVLATSDHKIVVFNGQGDGAGERQINWGYVEKQGQHFVSPPVLADINKDSYVDVIIADYNSGVKVFSGFNGEIIYHSTPDSSRENAIIGAPLVADVNGNGWLDILLRRNNDSFSLIKTNSRVKRGSIFWGQLHQNPLQNGFLPSTKQSLWKYYSVLAMSALLVLMLVFINGRCEWKRKLMFTRVSSDN